MNVKEAEWQMKVNPTEELIADPILFVHLNPTFIGNFKRTPNICFLPFKCASFTTFDQKKVLRVYCGMPITILHITPGLLLLLRRSLGLVS